MKTEHATYIVESAKAPTIEMDTEAGAAYVRFKTGRVARSIPHHRAGLLATVDLNAAGEVLGIEAIGFTDFVLEKLLATAGVSAPKVDFAKARFRATAAAPA